MILISLMGEQPIPNLMPLWQFPEFTTTQFAATSSTAPRAEALANAIHRDPQLQQVKIAPTLTLEAYHIGKSRLKLARAIADWQAQGETVCLNFTGGTKIMSGAALLAAGGTGAQLMYVSSEEDCVIFYQSDGVEIRRVPLQVSISVQQYLEACGLEVEKPNPNSALVPPKEGDPLEIRVLRAAQKSGIFDDVQRGVKVRRILPDGKTVKNELDIVVTRNGKLAICSCKSGRNVSNNDLYELSAISARENLGIYCGKVLVASDPDIPPGVIERARVDRILLVDHRNLAQVDFYLKQATD